MNIIQKTTVGISGLGFLLAFVLFAAGAIALLTQPLSVAVGHVVFGFIVLFVVGFGGMFIAKLSGAFEDNA